MLQGRISNLVAWKLKTEGASRTELYKPIEIGRTAKLENQE